MCWVYVNPEAQCMDPPIWLARFTPVVSSEINQNIAIEYDYGERMIMRMAYSNYPKM